MAIKKLISNQPVRYIETKDGKKIPVYRAGQLDTNKHARLTPHEKHNKAQLGRGKRYKPPPKVKK